MSPSADNRWLHRFAVFTALCTLALIGLGGLVTSHGVGMSVPDWPTTYGYNMFLFPISQWVGGIFYEHTHRLLASAVGLLTAILAIWLWARETSGRDRRNGIALILAVLFVVGGMMGVRITPVFITIALISFGGIILGLVTIKQTSGLRWYGIVALSAVVLQGVLGGLRVTEMKDEIGVFHATLAQLFLVLTGVIALFTSPFWKSISTSQKIIGKGMSAFVGATTLLIFAQLVLGATMRHQHAGLAVPDFPLAYGKVWPPTDAASIERMNQNRHDARDPNPITATHIVVHMAHRVTAFLILGGVTFLTFRLWKAPGVKHQVTRLALVWSGMILAQLALGVITVLKNKPADIATAHVVLGATSLVMGAVITIVARKISVEGRKHIPHLGAASSVEPASDSKAALTT